MESSKKKLTLADFLDNKNKDREWTLEELNNSELQFEEIRADIHSYTGEGRRLLFEKKGNKSKGNGSYWYNFINSYHYF